MGTGCCWELAGPCPSSWLHHGQDAAALVLHGGCSRLELIADGGGCRWAGWCYWTTIDEEETHRGSVCAGVAGGVTSVLQPGQAQGGDNTAIL